MPCSITIQGLVWQKRAACSITPEWGVPMPGHCWYNNQVVCYWAAEWGFAQGTRPSAGTPRLAAPKLFSCANTDRHYLAKHTYAMHSTQYTTCNVPNRHRRWSIFNGDVFSITIEKRQWSLINLIWFGEIHVLGWALFLYVIIKMFTILIKMGSEATHN